MLSDNIMLSEDDIVVSAENMMQFADSIVSTDNMISSDNMLSDFLFLGIFTNSGGAACPASCIPYALVQRRGCKWCGSTIR
jgi:hypothetical protein